MVDLGGRLFSRGLNLGFKTQPIRIRGLFLDQRSDNRSRANHRFKNIVTCFTNVDNRPEFIL